jgi:hypothetical protein
MARAASFVMVLGLLAGPAGAQEVYTVQPTKAGQGTALFVEKQVTHHSQVVVQDQAGKVLQNKEQTFTDTITHRETILAWPPGQARPTHLQKNFEQARRQSGKLSLTLPFEAKTYDIEWREGRFKFRDASSAPLPKEAVAALDGEYNGTLGGDFDWEKVLLPTRPVHVNETWTPDLQQIIAVIGPLSGMTIDPAHSTATARLTQVYQRNGRLFAVVDAAVDLAATAVRAGPNVKALQPGSGLSLRLRFNACIDGSAEAFTVESNMEIKGTVLAPGPNQTTVAVNNISGMQLRETRRQLQQ